MPVLQYVIPVTMPPKEIPVNAAQEKEGMSIRIINSMKIAFFIAPFYHARDILFKS